MSDSLEYQLPDAKIESRNKQITVLCCIRFSHENFFFCYTYFLLILELLNLLYYLVLIYHHKITYQLPLFIVNLSNIGILTRMISRYNQNYDYGQNLHFYFSALVYYLNLLSYSFFFASIILFSIVGLEEYLFDPGRHMSKSELMMLMVIIYCFMLPHAVIDLYLKHLYFKVIKDKRLENQVKGRAFLVDSEMASVDSEASDDQGSIF